MYHKLENQIREHAETIFGNDPLEGHRERFAQKLQPAGVKKQIPIRRMVGYLSVAAVLAGVILFSVHFLIPQQTVEDEPLSEVQNYYAMLLQDKIDEIEQLLPLVDEDERAYLLQDIVSMQQEAELTIQNSDEQNITFIVMTYSPKIESLQHIQDILIKIIKT